MLTRTNKVLDATVDPVNWIPRHEWVFITGGCSGRGLQWMGVVLYNQHIYRVHSIIDILDYTCIILYIDKTIVSNRCDYSWCIVFLYIFIILYNT